MRILLLVLIVLTTACRNRTASLAPGNGFEQSNLETVSGSIQSVTDTATSVKPCCLEIEVVLDDGGELQVDLGPATYLQHHAMTLRPGDRVTVTGMRVVINGEEVMVASSVKHGTQELQVRNPAALPAWGSS